MRYVSPVCAVVGLLSVTVVHPVAASPQSTPVPGISSAGDSIARAADGSMWLTEPASPGRVARVAPGGAVTEYTGGVTPNFTAGRAPDGMAITSDGYAWFLLHGGTDEVGRVSLATGAVYRYKLTSGTPTSIAAGSDGKVWMTANSDYGTDFVARYSHTDNVTQSFTAGFTSQTAPRSLTAGSDGALWFVEGASAGRLGRITTDGAVTFRSVGTAPGALGVGPGGLWFSRSTQLGLIGTVSNPLFETGGAQPTAIAAGPDDAVWSATTGGIVRVGPDGTVSTFPAGLAPSAKGTGLAAGPDGRMWMTLDRSPFLVRITVPPRAGSATGAGTSPSTATVTAEVRPNGLATTAELQVLSGGQWSKLAESAVGDGLVSTPVRFDVVGLAAGAFHTLRVVSTNEAGFATSPEVEVETEDEPIPTPTPAPTDTPPTDTPTPSPTPTAELTQTDTPTPSPTATPTATPTPAPTPSDTPTDTPTAVPAVPTPSAAPTTAPAPAAQPTPTQAPAEAAAPAPDRPAAVPAPILGTTIVVAPIRGTATYRVPGSDTSRPIDGAASIPTGSVIDTTKGAITLSSRVDGDVQQGRFSGGEFKVKQVRATGMTQLYLKAKLDCSEPGTKAVRAAKGKKRRHVWGEDKNGRFETHGRDSVATVRGTKWLTTDTCSATVVKVYEGEVSVRPRRTEGDAVIVKAGGRHVTRSPR